jgi:hypothetical protein
MKAKLETLFLVSAFIVIGVCLALLVNVDQFTAFTGSVIDYDPTKDLLKTPSLNFFDELTK